MADKLYIDETPDEVKNAKVSCTIFPSLSSHPLPNPQTHTHQSPPLPFFP